MRPCHYWRSLSKLALLTLEKGLQSVKEVCTVWPESSKVEARTLG